MHRAGNTTTLRRARAAAVAVVAVAAALVGCTPPADEPAAGGTTSTPAPGPRQFGGGFVAIPGSAPSTSVVALHDEVRDGRTVARLSRFDAGRPDAVWTSEPVGDDAYAEVIVDGAHAYVATSDGRGDALVAIDLGRGTEAWRVVLDEHGYEPSCTGCFTVVDDLVLLATDDKRLRAFAASDGRQRWSRELDDAAADVVRVGSRLVLLDRDERAPDGEKASLVTLDLATGLDDTTIPARCEAPARRAPMGIDLVTDVWPSPTDDTLLVNFAGMCVQGWNVAIARQRWSAVSREQSFTYRPKVFGSTAGIVLVGKDQVHVVDPTGGTIRSLVEADGTEYVGIGVAGDAVIVSRTPDPPSAPHDVVALDLVTGDQLWRRRMGDARPLRDGAPFDLATQDGYLASTYGDVVLLATFDNAPAQDQTVGLVALDARSGNPTAERSGELGTAPLRRLGPARWAGDELVVRVGEAIVVLDPVAGAVVSRFG